MCVPRPAGGVYGLPSLLYLFGHLLDANIACKNPSKKRVLSRLRQCRNREVLAGWLTDPFLRLGESLIASSVCQNENRESFLPRGGRRYGRILEAGVPKGHVEKGGTAAQPRGSREARGGCSRVGRPEREVSRGAQPCLHPKSVATPPPPAQSFFQCALIAWCLEAKQRFRAEPPGIQRAENATGVCFRVASCCWWRQL